MTAMPNKTIYVSDVDLPIFEEAQALAGDNLSATIIRALRGFILTEQARREGFEDVTVKVGTFPPYKIKQFKGRLLGKQQRHIENGMRLLTIAVYQTLKGKFAVRTKNTPDYANWSTFSEQEWDERGWQPAYAEGSERSLEVYDTLEEVQSHIPQDLYEAIVENLKGEDIEILDI